LVRVEGKREGPAGAGPLLLLWGYVLDATELHGLVAEPRDDLEFSTEPFGGTA
jgi:hypothetical protein